MSTLIDCAIDESVVGKKKEKHKDISIRKAVNFQESLEAVRVGRKKNKRKRSKRDSAINGGTNHLLGGVRIKQVSPSSVESLRKRLDTESEGTSAEGDEKKKGKNREKEKANTSRISDKMVRKEHSAAEGSKKKKRKKYKEASFVVTLNQEPEDDDEHQRKRKFRKHEGIDPITIGLIEKCLRREKLEEEEKQKKKKEKVSAGESDDS